MRNQAVKDLRGTSGDLEQQRSPRGPLIVRLLPLLSWTTEGHLQTVVLQDRDSTHERALKIAGDPN